MKIFGFDPAEHVAAFRDEGWVHIPGGVTTDFHRLLVDYAEKQLTDHLLDGFAIKGKKEQALFEFPVNAVGYPNELFDVVAELCGLQRATMTLSERHIQAYEPNAAPEPAAHKDRFPSQVSVGLSIAIPEESTLVLYPYDHLELNRFNTSAGLRASLQPHQLPEVVLRDSREVEINDHDGDVVVFHGSTTWHLRRRAARSINLYLKFNDFGADPLGEDPRTPVRRAATLAALRAADEALEPLIPVLSRQMDVISRSYTRTWDEILQAKVFGEDPFGLSRVQFEALQAVDGRQNVAGLTRALTNGHDPAQVRSEVLRLAARGALDLIAP
jgi:hypothetical protein